MTDQPSGRAGHWMTPEGLREMLRSLVTYEGGQSQLAKRLGVSPAYLCDVLASRREPGSKILKGLGCRRVVIYEIDEATHD
jgi:predicted transcriptional regulator